VRIGKVLEAHHHGVEISTANSAAQAHQISSRQEIGADVLTLFSSRIISRDRTATPRSGPRY
jgi:hypothetical protein